MKDRLSHRYFFATLALIPLALSLSARTRQTQSPQPRNHYQIKLNLDFENRTYTGTEVVRFINLGERPIASLFFHLYPNIRVPGYTPPATDTRGQATSDEPRLQIVETRAASGGAPLLFDLDDQETTLRIDLREALAPKAAVELEIKFKGSVPEIDSEETGLVTHVVQQVSAAIRNTRELRRARDTNFVCRGVMMLGTSYPILAARDGDDWFRKVTLNIGDTVMTEVADYDVTVEAPGLIRMFGPVATQSLTQKNNVRSIFRSEHEPVARRVLNIAADAVRVFSKHFGTLPMTTVSIVDAPLVATLSSAEFSGLSAIASAFYLDFESPMMRNMPEVIREQRASVEDSLEWTVAHLVAHAWSGAAV